MKKEGIFIILIVGIVLIFNIYYSYRYYNNLKNYEIALNKYWVVQAERLELLEEIKELHDILMYKWDNK